MANQSESAQEQAISFDMMSDTLVFEGLRPSAVALTVMSRSVSVPFNSSASQTGMSPTSRSFIFAAASFNEALDPITSTSMVIISPRRIANLVYFRIFYAGQRKTQKQKIRYIRSR